MKFPQAFRLASQIALTNLSTTGVVAGRAQIAVKVHAGRVYAADDHRVCDLPAENITVADGLYIADESTPALYRPWIQEGTTLPRVALFPEKLGQVRQLPTGENPTAPTFRQCTLDYTILKTALENIKGVVRKDTSLQFICPGSYAYVEAVRITTKETWRARFNLPLLPSTQAITVATLSINFHYLVEAAQAVYGFFAYDGANPQLFAIHQLHKGQTALNIIHVGSIATGLISIAPMHV